MDDIVVVSKVKGQQELDGEPVDNLVRRHAVIEPDTKAPQRLSHELKYETDMGSVGTLVLEIIDEVTDVGIAELSAVSVTKMGEDFSLKYGLVPAIGVGTKHLESPESVLVIIAANQSSPHG